MFTIVILSRITTILNPFNNLEYGWMYTIFGTQDWLTVIDLWISKTAKIVKLGSNEDLSNTVNNDNREM